MDELTKLPLWRNCLERMRADGVSFGKAYPADFFEAELKSTRDTLAFGIGISEIRRALEWDGFYLSGRGQKGSQYVILNAAANASVMQSYGSSAVDLLKRAVILGSNTSLETLTEGERRKHDAVLERTSIKAALLARASQIAKVLRQHKPELLG